MRTRTPLMTPAICLQKHRRLQKSRSMNRLPINSRLLRRGRSLALFHRLALTEHNKPTTSPTFVVERIGYCTLEKTWRSWCVILTSSNASRLTAVSDNGRTEDVGQFEFTVHRLCNHDWSMYTPSVHINRTFLIQLLEYGGQTSLL